MRKSKATWHICVRDVLLSRLLGASLACSVQSSSMCALQMSIRDEDTLPLSLPPQQRDSISRVSAEPVEGMPPHKVHRDDSARVSKGVNAIVT